MWYLLSRVKYEEDISRSSKVNRLQSVLVFNTDSENKTFSAIGIIDFKITLKSVVRVHWVGRVEIDSLVTNHINHRFNSYRFAAFPLSYHTYAERVVWFSNDIDRFFWSCIHVTLCNSVSIRMALIVTRKRQFSSLSWKRKLIKVACDVQDGFENNRFIAFPT